MSALHASLRGDFRFGKHPFRESFEVVTQKTIISLCGVYHTLFEVLCVLPHKEGHVELIRYALPYAAIHVIF